MLSNDVLKNNANSENEDSDNEEQQSTNDIFGGLLNSTGENAIEMKEKRLARRKEIISKIKLEENHIKPFAAYATVIKQNPLQVMEYVKNLKTKDTDGSEKKLPALKP